MTMILDYLFNAMALGVTFLYGSTGEIITEKVGHLNLGIPGIMCVGGMGGCIALYALYGSGCPAFLIVLLAMLATVLSGALMGALYCFLTVTLHANQNVTGLAMTIFGAGISKFIIKALDQVRYVNAVRGSVAYFRYPFADLTLDLQKWGIMFFLAFVIAILASLILTKTRVGLHLRAVGENPATADAVGINVTAYKYGATCIGSAIAALGGLYYTMDYSGSPEAFLQIEDLGWLSIALVIFALWKPHLSILGSALFGFLYVANSYLPSILNLVLPRYAPPLLKMLPYVVTILVLIISSIRKKRENQPPASLGQSYFREER